MEYGWPLEKRRAYLTDLAKETTSSTQPILFEGEIENFPIHSVPIELPLYRLENGRTTDRQIEHLAKYPSLPTNFFRSNTEAPEVQLAQHKLLVSLSKERKNLFTEFRKSPQNEPIILSHLGYVVNGNRRLSTWRALYEENPTKFVKFAGINVVILPYCDAKALDRLEANLQIKEDLKAPYSWTAQALMLREKQSSAGYTEKELSVLYGTKLPELRKLMESFDYASEYLDSRDRSNRYSEVESKQYAFRQIAATRPKMKANETKKELFEIAAFCIVDEHATGERIYSEIPKIAKYIDAVIDNLQSEFDIECTTEDLSPVTDILTIEGNFDTARSVIRDTIESEVALKKKSKQRDYILTQVTKAKQALADAKSSANDKSSKAGLSNNLDTISDLVVWLRDWAEDE